MKRPVSSIFSHLPLTLKKPKKTFSFGTSGYRDQSENLTNVLCRTSLLAMIRSSTFCGKMIGIMITASHNKNTDNGAKIVDHNGDYIDKNLEEYCDEIVNCSDKDLLKILNKVHRKLGNMRDLGNGPSALIAIGRDTRVSGINLEEKIKEVLDLFGCKIIHYGVITTPQLHFLVRKGNQLARILKKEEYYDALALNYNEILSLSGTAEAPVYLDCANGVGGIAASEMCKRLKNKAITIINKGEYKNNMFIPDHNFLNEQCGADYVLSNMTIPKNITEDATKLKKCASLDGDADRLIYFTTCPKFSVLNGDKFAVFLANYFYNLCTDFRKVSIGVVLSHYSNTAAKNYLRDKVDVVTANTGVKNFIRKSRQFDIGIFFEPNGHGSVTFSEKMMVRVNEILSNEVDNYLTKNARIIKALSNIFDPCVGDALGNFLVFEAITDDQMFMKAINMYDEMPTRMFAVKIKDKRVLVMDNDIDLQEPEKLILAINSISKDFGGRVFVRPSGTEDIVRIFAEASTQADCDKLCLMVADAVYTICEGVGYHPEITYEKVEKAAEAA